MIGSLSDLGPLSVLTMEAPMATPLKRVLFFLLAVSVLRASPALSVPLASTVDSPGAVVSGGSDYTLAGGETDQPADGRYSPFQQVRGGTDGTESKARIVDSESGQAAMNTGGSSHTGWLLPVAAVGAGGGSLFALLSHGNKHGNNGTDGSGINVGAGGSPNVNLGLGTTTDDPPSAVPEPGTITLMGLGIASILGGRKIVKR